MQGENPQQGRSHYLDFEMEIGEGRGRDYPVAVLRSPSGEARAIMHFPFDELALDNRLSKLQIALLRSGGTHRRVLTDEERAVQDFGQALFDALLGGDIRSCYDVSLREADQQDKGLRLKLRIHPPELNALPWEFMYDSRQAEYVCLSRQTPIVRYLESPRRIRPLTVDPPLRILGMIASPQDQPALDVEREKERMERAVLNLQRRGLVQLEWLPGQTWRDLHEAMWGGPWHIFHFIGHGGFDANTDEGFIALADRAEKTNCLSATRLGRLLADHTALRLVVLNSCEGARGSERDIFSSTAAILVRRGILAALAMQYEITDRAAIEFARAFYQALAYGMTVDEAVVAARKAISLAVTNTVEWGTPVLYMRTPDGVLFQITQRLQAEASRPEESEPSARAKDGQEQLTRQIAALYDEAQKLARNRQWRQALTKMAELRALDPQFIDSEQIIVRAQAEIGAEEREALKQSVVQMTAESADSRRRIPSRAMVTIGEITLVALILLVTAFVIGMRLGGTSPREAAEMIPTTASIVAGSTKLPLSTPSSVPTHSPEATYMVFPLTNTPPSPTATETLLPAATFTPEETRTAPPSTSAPPSSTATELPPPSPAMADLWQQGKIAFVSKQGDHNRLYVQDLIEGTNAQLPEEAGAKNNLGPWWSPDGRWLAFYTRVAARDEVMIVSGAGDKVPQSVGSELEVDFTSSPTWAHDGERIVCYGTKGKTYFYILDAFSGRLEAQLDPGMATARLPAWSPDGDLIAFASKEDGNWDIYMMPAVGGVPVNLTLNSAENYAPAWSPKGKWIAYQSDLNRGGSLSEIWIVDPAGRNPVRITYSPSGTWSRAPAWSPDSQWIVFVSNQAGSIGADYGELFVVSIGTGEISQLTDTGGRVYDWRPSWGP